MSVLEDLSQPPQSLPGKPGFHRNRWTAEQSPSWRLCPHEGWLRNLTGRGGGPEHPPAAKPLVIQGGVAAAGYQSQELLPLQMRPSVGGSAHPRRNAPDPPPQERRQWTSTSRPGILCSPPEPDENGCVTDKETKAQVTYTHVYLGLSDKAEIPTKLTVPNGYSERSSCVCVCVCTCWCAGLGVWCGEQHPTRIKL